MGKARDYYNSLLNYDALSSEDKNKFLTTRGLQDRSYNDIVQIYKNTKFKEAFGNNANYEALINLPSAQRDLLLSQHAANKTKERFFNEKIVGAENATKIAGLTPEGLQDLINSDWDIDNYIDTPDLSTLTLTGTGIGAAIGGVMAGTAGGVATAGVGAVPAAALGAWAGGKFGTLIGGAVGLVSSAIESFWNNDENSKLNKIIADDNERKERISSEIMPEVSNLLDNIISGNAFNSEESRAEAMPVIKALQAYGVDVNKGEASVKKQGEGKYDTLFNKVVGQHSPHWQMFEGREELADLNDADKLKMIKQTLATDLTFQDGGFSSSSINSQNIQNHISNNQAWNDWLGNSSKNVVVGALGALGETVAGTAALAAYAIDEANSLVGNETNYTKAILEGKTEDGSDMPLLMNLAYWDGVDKFNTFEPEIIEKARENGGISPYNNVTLAGEEGKFFSWASVNEAIKMGKYAVATAATSRLLGATSRGLSKVTAKTMQTLGTSATKAETAGIMVDKFGSMGTYLAAGVPVSAGYGLGAYEDVKANLTQKEDERVAALFYQQHLESDEFKNRVAKIQKELLNPETSNGVYTKEAARETAIEQAKWEARQYFSDYVKNNRDELSKVNPALKDKRDEIDRIAVDAYAVDATIEGIKNTFVNLNFRSYLFDKKTTEMLKGEASTPVAYNKSTGQLEQISKDIRGKNIKSNVRIDQARAVGKQLWGGFFSNYTDDITTGAVETAAERRYDDYLKQKYNGKAAGNIADLIGYTFSLAQAMLEGADAKSVDPMSWYDGFIGALGSITPGSGGLPTLSPYNTNKTENKDRSWVSKTVERLARTSGIGATAYDTYYQHKTTGEVVDFINEEIEKKALDISDIFDLASATEAAKESKKEGNILNAKTDKTKAFLTTLLYVEANKDNAIFKATPQLQRWLKLLGLLKSKNYKDSEEYESTVKELANELLKEPSNKDLATLPEEEAMSKAIERVTENLDKASDIIKSMDEAAAELRLNGYRTESNSFKSLVTIRVQADQYKKRIGEMEETLGLPDGSTMSTHVTSDGMLARYRTRKKLEDRIQDLEYEFQALKKDLLSSEKMANSDSKEGKSVYSYRVKYLKRRMNEIIEEQRLAKKAIQENFKEGEDTSDRVFKIEEIKNLDSESRASLIKSYEGAVVTASDSEQRAIVEDLKKEYREQGVEDLVTLFDDLDVLKKGYDCNMEQYTDHKNDSSFFDAKHAHAYGIFMQQAKAAIIARKANALKDRLIELKKYTSNNEEGLNTAVLQELHNVDEDTLDYMESESDYAPIKDELKAVSEFKYLEESRIRDLQRYINPNPTSNNGIVNRNDNAGQITLATIFDFLTSKGISVLDDNAAQALIEEDASGNPAIKAALDEVQRDLNKNGLNVTLLSPGDAYNLFNNIINGYKEHKREIESREAPIEATAVSEEASNPPLRPEVTDEDTENGETTVESNDSDTSASNTRTGIFANAYSSPDEGFADTETKGNTTLEAFERNNPPEVFSAVKTAFTIIENTINGYSDNTKESVKALIESLKDAEFDSVDTFIDELNRIANDRSLHSEDGTSEVARLLQDITSKLDKANQEGKFSETQSTTNASTPTPTNNNSRLPEEDRRINAAIDMFPAATYASGFIASLNIEWLREVSPNHPIVAYYNRYHIEDAIRAGILESNPEIFFITDKDLEESLSKDSNYQESKDLPIIAVVESENGPITIDGKKYQPVSVMTSTKEQQARPDNISEADETKWRQETEISAGAMRVSPIRALGLKTKGETALIKTEEGNPLKTTLYGNVKAHGVDNNLNAANDALEVGINDLNLNEEEVLRNSPSKKERRTGIFSKAIYRKVRNKFLKGLRRLKTSTEKELVYEQDTLKGSHNQIKVFVKSIGKSTARDSNKTFLETIKDGDEAVIHYNSRTERASKLIEKFFKDIQTLLTNNDIVFDEDTGEILEDSALNGLISSVLDKIVNHINFPLKNECNFSIKASLQGEKVSFRLSLKDNSDNELFGFDFNEDSLNDATKINEYTASIIKGIILDSEGNIKLNDKGFEFAKWNVNYEDVASMQDDSKSEDARNQARSNIEDIYDDGLFDVAATALDYRIQGIAVNNPLNTNAPAYEERANTDNAQRSAPVNNPTITGSNQTNSGEAIVDGDTGAVLSGTPKVPKTEAIKEAEAKVEEMHEKSKDLKLNEDETAYENKKTGINYARVTKFIEADEKAGEPFDPKSPWVTPSTNIGTGFDNLVRDLFDDELFNNEFKLVDVTDNKGTHKEWRVGEKRLSEVYPNANDIQLNKFVEDLIKFKNRLTARGFKVISKDIKAFGVYKVTDSQDKIHEIPVAGTLDLLVIDSDGNFHIFDMKTHRGKITDAKKNKWGRQLFLYKKFLEDEYGITVKSTRIIPIKVDYNDPSTVDYTVSDTFNNQLMVGNRMFKNAQPELEPMINIKTPDNLSISWGKLDEQNGGLIKVLEEQLAARTNDSAKPVSAEVAEPPAPAADPILGVPIMDMSFMDNAFGFDTKEIDDTIASAEIEDISNSVTPSSMPTYEELLENEDTEVIERLEEMGITSEEEWEDLIEEEKNNKLNCARNSK